jgi:cellulose synthase/poly-beta-1,6-N-acetylglucosamine synthase-like glycosyltransferase
MEFLNNAYVYDEKVSTSGVFQKQRTRWLEAQLNQVRRFFRPDMKNTPKTALYFHVFLQTLFLPRLLYLVICCIVVFLLLVQWVSGISLFYPSYWYWLAWLITYSMVLLISIPLRFYSVKTLQAMAFIPVLMVSMLKALMKVKRNRKEFLHTSKSYHDKQ